MARAIRRAFVLGLAVAMLGCGSAAPTPPAEGGPSPVPPAPPSVPKVLVVTHTAGFRHDSIPAAEQALAEIASAGGFAVEFCRTAVDVRDRLTVAGLTGVDAVFFANTTGNLGIPDLAAFLGWLAAGKGFIGAHSASDTYHDAPEYLAMLGGEFTTHGAIVEATVLVNDPASAVVAHLAPQFTMTDEWYRFRAAGPAPTVLLSFDRNPPDGVGTPGKAVDLPLAWQKRHGSGRVFYTALGHRAEVWGDPRFRTHLREAIRWAIGR